MTSPFFLLDVFLSSPPHPSRAVFRHSQACARISNLHPHLLLQTHESRVAKPHPQNPRPPPPSRFSLGSALLEGHQWAPIDTSVGRHPPTSSVLAHVLGSTALLGQGDGASASRFRCQRGGGLSCYSIQVSSFWTGGRATCPRMSSVSPPPFSIYRVLRLLMTWDCLEPATKQIGRTSPALPTTHCEPTPTLHACSDAPRAHLFSHCITTACLSQCDAGHLGVN